MAGYRRDVVAVARKHEAPLNQIAKDFGVSDSCPANWLKRADVEDGIKPGVTERVRLDALRGGLEVSVHERLPA